MSEPDLVTCGCESAVCPSDHNGRRCLNPMLRGMNMVDMIGECCDECYPHYRDAGYAVDPATGRPLGARVIALHSLDQPLVDRLCSIIRALDADRGDGGIYWRREFENPQDTELYNRIIGGT